MKKLLTQGEVCELLRMRYGTLNRMLNAGGFVAPVNGRGKKLLFDPDSVEAWIKSRQQQVAPAANTQGKRDKKSFEQRQAAADAALQRHAAEQ